MGLIDIKSKQLVAIRGVMEKKGAAGDQMLLEACFKAFRDIHAEALWEKENADKIAFFEEKMKSMAGTQADNNKAVLGRMCAAGDQVLLEMCFNAFFKYHEDYQKDKVNNDAVKAAEARMRTFQSSRKDKGKGVLAKMEAATTKGLLHEVVSAFSQWYQDQKKEEQLIEILNNTEGKFSSFGESNKKSAHSVMERARKFQEEMVYRKHFNAWRTDAKTSKLASDYQAKIDGKKQQLHSVQTLFRQFAAQLEAGMKEQVSARELYKRRTKTQTPAGGLTSSLPDIHSGHVTPKTSMR